MASLPQLDGSVENHNASNDGWIMMLTAFSFALIGSCDWPRQSDIRIHATDAVNGASSLILESMASQLAVFVHFTSLLALAIARCIRYTSHVHHIVANDSFYRYHNLQLRSRSRARARALAIAGVAAASAGRTCVKKFAILACDCISEIAANMNVRTNDTPWR